MQKYVTAFIFITAAAVYLFFLKSVQSQSVSTKPSSTIQKEKSILKEDIVVRVPAAVAVSTSQISEKKPVLNVSEELRQILANNNYCGFQKLDRHKLKKADFEYMEEFIFGPENKNSGDDEKGWDLECFHSNCRGQISEILGPDLSEATKFYNAVYIAGLSMADYNSDSKNGVSAEDLQRSYYMLLELTNKNPNNGAYPFFLAAIEKQLNMPQEKVDEHIRMTLLAPDFELFQSKLLRQMYINYGLSSPLVNAVFFSAFTDYGPAMNQPAKLLNTFVKNHKEFQDSAMQFGEKLMKNFLNKGDRWYWWEDLPFSVGRLISKSAFEAKYPGKKLPPKYAKTMNDPYKGTQKRYKDLTKNLKPGACDIEFMTGELNHIRADLLSKQPI